MNPEWPLVLFTFFLCLSGGILGAQGLLTLLGRGKKMQMVSLISALATLVIGGIAVFLHLQHWERIFNGFGSVLGGNGFGVSGITLELWGCVIEFIVIALYFLFMRRAEDGVAPKWCAVLAIIIGLALPMVTGDSYLMEALPSWNTPLLVIYYLTNTLFMGGLAALIIAAATKTDDAKSILSKLALVGGIAQLIFVIVYAVVINGSAGQYAADIQYYFDPTLPDVAMVDRAGIVQSILAGANAPMFWLAVIIVGTIAPSVLVWLSSKLTDAKKDLTYASAALVCAVVGGICWRVILYWVALSIFPLY